MNSRFPDQSELLIAARGEVKDRKLRKVRRWATGLFLIVGVIYVLTTTFNSVHYSLKYIAVFCEAAMVGALADWFAVVALFRHPLWLKLPHTAILPQNKKRIAAGISEFIQDNFLSSKAIVAKIAEFGPANKLREWLLRKENAETVASYVTRLLSFAMTAFDDERVRTFLHGVVTSKLKEVDFASGAGQLLDVVTKDKRHHLVLNEVLRLLDEAFGKPETRDYIAKAVIAESTLIEMAKKIGLDFDEIIARKIVSGIAKAINQVRDDDTHVLRKRFDEFLALYIEKLKSDPSTRRKVQELLDEFIHNPALLAYVDTLWQEFRSWLNSDLANTKSKVHESVAGIVVSFGQRMDVNPELRNWIDEQILKAVPPFVDENKAKIGKFIEDKINDWHEEKFVTEMEREIGPDLQYIRINGTIVGGLAGLTIYTLSRMLA